MSATYTSGQIVMVRESRLRPDEWFIGIVTRGTDPVYGWTKADVNSSPSSVSTTVPGWDAEDLRLASEHDIADLPEWQRSWLDELLLNRRNPRVPYSTRPIAQALSAVGIKRLEDLQRFADADLLALKGIGKKALAELRSWQQIREEQEGG